MLANHSIDLRAKKAKRGLKESRMDGMVCNDQNLQGVNDEVNRKAKGI